MGETFEHLVPVVHCGQWPKGMKREERNGTRFPRRLVVSRWCLDFKWGTSPASEGLVVFHLESTIVVFK